MFIYEEEIEVVVLYVRMSDCLPAAGTSHVYDASHTICMWCCIAGSNVVVFGEHAPPILYIVNKAIRIIILLTRSCWDHL